MFWNRARPSRRGPRDDASAAATPGEPFSSGPAARLVDLAGDWLTLVAALRGCPEIPDAGRLRERALELRNDLERRAREAQFGDADIRSATFSLTAFTDETVRRARGRAREEWIARPLQLEWFQTSNAGVEFYDQLDELRKDRGRRIEAIEVSTFCLALGFEGKLAITPEKRSGLLDDLLIDIGAARGAGEISLAPRAIPKDRPMPSVVPEMPRWISVAAFALAALLIWLAVTQASRIGFSRTVTGLERAGQP